MSARAPLHLEGTTLEGGGQLLRIAIGVSSLTKVPINITNIRGKRSGGGGLKAQHLTSVQWLGKASKARVSGIGLKSKEITFVPNIQGGQNSHEREMEIKQSTPGSVNLVFQALLPYLLFSQSSGPLPFNTEGAAHAQRPIQLRVTGGTNVSNSPSFEYIQQVLVPMLEKIGIPLIGAEVHSRGWSQGTTRLGTVTYTVTPLSKKLPAFQLVDRGVVKSVKATIIAPRETERMIRDELDVMFEKAEHLLFGTNGVGDIEITFEDSRHEKRYYLLLVATTSTGMKLGRDWLYDRGVRAGKPDTIVSSLVKQVANELITELKHGGCVDEFLRDQLVIFQALAEGTSAVDGGKRKGEYAIPSLHTKTAQWVVGEMLGVKFDEAGSCEGSAFVPGSNNTIVEHLAEGLQNLVVKN
ncbi:RNA 3'-terminal phosphate cyclase domain-containing protein [Dendryphion nanum]|uniref:RNA 3'-terminal phosphate cyclase domain-containing protein n=1 Tax=Dendryphion nanum TaxID=256645 RepID=A0A9P9DAT6_9PLEO|nr:RNA 3'-terminal phosphate cyclase domain-containing protein [Dendryphion nanum]